MEKSSQFSQKEYKEEEEEEEEECNFSLTHKIPKRWMAEKVVTNLDTQL